MKRLSGNDKNTCRVICRAFSILILIIITGFLSCKKNSEISLKANVDAANDVVLAESNFRFVFDLLLKAEKDSVLWKTGNTRIDSSSVLADTLNRVLYFDFSTQRCPDSIVRTGRIQVNYQGRIFHKGYKGIVTFVSYVVDVDPLTGTYTLTNLGLNEKKAWVIKVEYPDGEITKMIAGGKTTYSGESRFIFDSVTAMTMPDLSWYMTGGFTGRSASGYPIRATIGDSLISKLTCPWICSGRINLTVSGAEIEDGYIDFVNDGKCTPATIYNFGGNIFYNTALKRYQN